MQFQLQHDNALVNTTYTELFNGKYGDFENGLFWQINTNGDGPKIIFQNGGAFGTSSWICLIPELEIGVFIITNTAGPDVHKELNNLSNRIISFLK